MTGEPSGAAPAPLRLRPLTMVDGDDIVVGDPEAGTFVAMPPVGR